MRALKNVALTGASLAIATMLVSANPAIAGSDSGVDDASADMIAAMSRDLHLTPEQAHTRLLQQERAQQVAATLPAQVRDNNAGTWFDKHTGKLVVAVTDQATAEQAEAAGAQAKFVERDHETLDRLLGEVRSLAKDDVAGLAAWGIDPVRNAVTVRVDVTKQDDTTLRFLDRIASLGDGVQVREQTQSPTPNEGEIRGGDPWFYGEDGPCSIGFSATDESGGNHFLTAGHCADVPDTPASVGEDRQPVGTSNVGGKGSVFSPEGDMGLVTVTEPGWKLSPGVNTWGAEPVSVTGTVAPVVGQAVCRSGNTTHWQCGEVTQLDQTVNYPDTDVEGVVFATATSDGGDSGGSWVAGDKAIGLHSGLLANGESVFQPIDEALAKWKLTLVTG